MVAYKNESENQHGAVMKRTELDRMSTDDLWSLHVEVSELLQQRIQTEKQLLKRIPVILKHSLHA